MDIVTISPGAFAQRYRDGGKCELIDVRMPNEFQTMHVEFARNIPLVLLDPGKEMQARGCIDEPLYLICQTGGRSRKACEKFLQAGLINVVSVEGGTQGCADAGLPMLRGKKSISLERQVRIAAGLLVLIGILLGWLVHPALFGLAAFIGAGLVFAGITDTCGMGLLLARMPWNRIGLSASTCCDR